MVRVEVETVGCGDDSGHTAQCGHDCIGFFLQD